MPFIGRLDCNQCKKMGVINVPSGFYCKFCGDLYTCSEEHWRAEMLELISENKEEEREWKIAAGSVGRSS